MKYKLIGMIACLGVLVLALSVAYASDSKEHRYHQHLEAVEKIECTEHGDEVFCTHLPLVEIETEGVEIPGEAIVSDTGKITGWTQTADGEDEIHAWMQVTDSETENNHAEDKPTVESEMLIHVRGNTSRTFDKSSYAIRLITETGENNAQEIMGMDAHHEWVLYGPYLDKSLIRNYMWYNIAGEIMDYAPNVRFCEVLLNGECQGVYLMVETITAGEDARLELSVDKKDNTFSGYVLRLDRGSSTEIKNIETFTKYAKRTGMDLNIEYPGTSNLTEELAESIRQDFSDFEKTLYSFDYDNKSYGYTTMLDVESFINYFLLNEFTCNYDAGWLSTYVYKDIDSKYRMCIWDFNSACDNYNYSQTDPQRFEMHQCLWYNMLIKDEDFTDQLICRYEQLRRTYLSDEYLNQYIDDVVDYLGPAIDRNYEKWGYSFAEEYDMLEPTERNPRTYEESVDDIKTFIRDRGAWMDENIDSLRQYSAESKVKKFNEHTE